MFFLEVPLSPIRIIILLVAAAAAIGAAFLVRNMAAVPELPVEIPVIQEPVKEPTVNVLVARRDMARGELLTEADMEWQSWPERALNPLFFNDRDQPTSMEDLSGAAVRNEIFENEPLMSAKLVEKGETGYMAALVKPGMRAVSIDVSPETASGGFILPDDRVDVVASYSVEFVDASGNEGTKPVTQTVLENVRVLAIDQVFRQNETGAYTPGSVATLELAPRDAEVLMLASRESSLRLVLRSFADAARDGPDTISRADRYLAVIAPGGADEKGSKVTIIRNGASQSVQVGGSN